jgi:hypothetical protein
MKNIIIIDEGISENLIVEFGMCCAGPYFAFRPWPFPR